MLSNAKQKLLDKSKNLIRQRAIRSVRANLSEQGIEFESLHKDDLEALIAEAEKDERHKLLTRSLVGIIAALTIGHV
ncbi:hypothetical protein [Litorivivens sp.]|uniref:hypothetical protein n=1 Tax=Litorivivens sp. TaxID=2020868 RepID=UPI0035631271